MSQKQNVASILSMNAFNSQESASENVSRRLANSGASSVLFYRNPIEMVSAKGAWMTDNNGTRYLDFYNNVPSIGHSHPRVVEAVSKQLATLNTNTRYIVPIVDEYIEALKATFPEYLSNVVLTCSGSEANDLAMRLATRHTNGTGFIVTESAYHGNTKFVTEVSPSVLKNNDLPDNVIAIPAPSGAVYGNKIEQGFAQSVVDAIQALQKRGIKLAALLVDTIFSSDGVYSSPAGFLQQAVNIVHDAGGLFIADEVQPGFGRTGDTFWAFMAHGVEPDIVTVGKPMGNGFPMAGVITRPRYLSKFCDDVGYFNTFGGNPVAAAAGLAVLNVISEEKLQDNALRVGHYLKQELERLASQNDCIGEVRGKGLFWGLDICKPDDPSQPDPILTIKLIDRFLEQKVLVGAAGAYGATLKLRPPLCLSMSEARLFVNAFENVINN